MTQSGYEPLRILLGKYNPEICGLLGGSPASKGGKDLEPLRKELERLALSNERHLRNYTWTFNILLLGSMIGILLKPYAGVLLPMLIKIYMKAFRNRPSEWQHVSEMARSLNSLSDENLTKAIPAFFQYLSKRRPPK